MPDLELYLPSLVIFGIVASLMLVQLLVADVIGIRRGHKPGHPILPDHDDFLFRAHRALANSNESVTIFALAMVFSIAVMANPAWLNGGAMVYVIGRVGHMLFYYLNLQTLRSLSFATSLIGMVIILVTGFSKLL